MMSQQIGHYSNQDAAIHAAEISGKDGVIIECKKSNLYFVEEGYGGMIRLFERITHEFSNGKITKKY